MPRTEEEWKKIANDFGIKWNFYNCLGSIDGKHIEIRKPPDSGSYYYNYKQTFSIVLMAVVNANYEFIMIDVGANGRVSDGGVFSNTKFYQKLKENKLKIPEPDYLPRSNIKLPFVFVADDAFPLSDNILKPYPQRNMTREQRIFNYRLSRARRIVENTFGILSSRFRILLNAINLEPDKTSTIVLACCYLHNFLRQKNIQIFLQDSFDFEDVSSGQVRPGSWRNNNQQLISLESCQQRNSTTTSKDIRNKYCEYFNNIGAVQWQNNIFNEIIKINK